MPLSSHRYDSEDGPVRHPPWRARISALTQIQYRLETATCHSSRRNFMYFTYRQIHCKQRWNILGRVLTVDSRDVVHVNFSSTQQPIS